MKKHKITLKESKLNLKSISKRDLGKLKGGTGETDNSIIITDLDEF